MRLPSPKGQVTGSNPVGVTKAEIVEVSDAANDMVCLRLSLSSGERDPVYWPHKSLTVEENSLKR